MLFRGGADVNDAAARLHHAARDAIRRAMAEALGGGEIGAGFALLKVRVVKQHVIWLDEETPLDIYTSV